MSVNNNFNNFSSPQILPQVGQKRVHVDIVGNAQGPSKKVQFLLQDTPNEFNNAQFIHGKTLRVPMALLGKAARPTLEKIEAVIKEHGLTHFCVERTSEKHLQNSF